MTVLVGLGIKSTLTRPFLDVAGKFLADVSDIPQPHQMDAWNAALNLQRTVEGENPNFHLTWIERPDMDETHASLVLLYYSYETEKGPLANLITREDLGETFRLSALDVPLPPESLPEGFLVFVTGDKESQPQFYALVSCLLAPVVRCESSGPPRPLEVIKREEGYFFRTDKAPDKVLEGDTYLRLATDTPSPAVDSDGK